MTSTKKAPAKSQPQSATASGSRTKKAAARTKREKVYRSMTEIRREFFPDDDDDPAYPGDAIRRGASGILSAILG
jgi:hypothetical protein